ncbi:PilN domain-containing protein [Senegalia massiliensis]|uniref:PilN domain-containing protein n=1 Tax=Senegalia massiliensis TaxID=1720316 RepID=UPI001031AB02|nr:PilN domain-containing protein [Senegalia massiliensis]
MTDINLFSPYIKKEKNSSINSKYIIISIALFLLLAIIYTGWYYYNTYKIQNNIVKMNNILNSKKVQSQLNKLEVKNKEIQILDKYLHSTNEINSEFEEVNTINTNIIKSINSSMPNSLYFSSMSITNNIVEINGTTENRESIAEFQQVLSEKDFFSNVYITSISKDNLNDKYIFVLTSILRGDENATK